MGQVRSEKFDLELEESRLGFRQGEEEAALASTGRCGEVKLGQIRSLLSRAQTLSEKWASQGQATEWYIQVLVIIGVKCHVI
ncbi:hypothetical protein K1719_010216 [Acacia pycnantha]|nr:hypothetical protein K1719_010216 [Acacia pycnantha]